VVSMTSDGPLGGGRANRWREGRREGTCSFRDCTAVYGRGLSSPRGRRRVCRERTRCRPKGAFSLSGVGDEGVQNYTDPGPAEGLTPILSLAARGDEAVRARGSCWLGAVGSREGLD
jgi:hypothetical protein